MDISEALRIQREESKRRQWLWWDLEEAYYPGMWLDDCIGACYR